MFWYLSMWCPMKRITIPENGLPHNFICICIWISSVKPQQQQQQQAVTDPSADELAKIAQAVSLPQIYGDERDAVIAKWNQLQALWGKGKGYYNRQQCVEFKPDNPFCRFKVCTYLILYNWCNDISCNFQLGMSSSSILIAHILVKLNSMKIYMYLFIEKFTMKWYLILPIYHFEFHACILLFLFLLLILWLMYILCSPCNIFHLNW